MEMGKRKKGRLRSRPGGAGPNQRGGNHYRHHARSYQPSASNGDSRSPEPVDNGEPGPVEPGSGIWSCTPTATGFSAIPTTTTPAR